MSNRRTYRLPHPSEVPADEYVSPPPSDDDGEEYRRALAVERRGRLTPLSIGEALAALMDDPAAWAELWRRRFPDSAEVVDGITQLEAAAFPVDEDDRRFQA